MIQNDNLASVSAKLIKKVEQYIKELRKNTEKDPLVELIV